MDSKRVAELARGLISSWLIDQVEDRSSLGTYASLAVSALGALIVVLLDGGWAIAGGVLLALGVISFLLVWLLKTFAKFMIRRFAEPESLADHRPELEEAISDIDLPMTPFAIVRFFLRLRKGVGPEYERVKTILSRLDSSLSDTDVATGATVSDDEPS